MIYISHRGNLEGINRDLENHPQQIDKAILCGFDVEVDLWLNDGHLYLGHDRADHRVDERFLLGRSQNLWVHAKNIESAKFLMGTNLHWFWHESDTFTLTSKGVAWSFLEVFFDSCVVNQPANSSKFWTDKLFEKINFHAICHDDIIHVKNMIDEAKSQR